MLLDRTCARARPLRHAARLARPRRPRPQVRGAARQPVPPPGRGGPLRLSSSAGPGRADHRRAARRAAARRGCSAWAGGRTRTRRCRLIQALAGHAAAGGARVLQEIADQPTRTASWARRRPSRCRPWPRWASRPAPPALSGDLELFGLPNLLQTLNQSQLHRRPLPHERGRAGRRPR